MILIYTYKSFLVVGKNDLSVSGACEITRVHVLSVRKTHVGPVRPTDEKGQCWRQLVCVH